MMNFSILETTLDLNQWYAFRPVLPVDKLSNINYGQKNSDYSNTKILKVNGIETDIPIFSISADIVESGSYINMRIRAFNN